MNEQELRGYALRGLKSRLSELDVERAEIVALLAQLEGSGPRTPRRRTPIAHTSQAARRSTATERATEPAVAVLPDEELEREVARVLPRRRATSTPVAAPPAPALPPMPRLVKASAG